MYHSIIGRAILGDLDKGTAESAVGLVSAVQSAMFCKCGSVLDVRTAVLFENPKRASVLCAECADSIRTGTGSVETMITDGSVTVTDGRVLSCRGLFGSKVARAKRKPSARMVDITVRTGNGSVTVRAHIAGRGLFAIHRPLGAAPRRACDRSWTVTHVPTGMAVWSGFRILKSARAFVREILTVPEDWQNLPDGYSPSPAVRASVRAIAERLQATENGIRQVR